MSRYTGGRNEKKNQTFFCSVLIPFGSKPYRQPAWLVSLYQNFAGQKVDTGGRNNLKHLVRELLVNQCLLLQEDLRYTRKPQLIKGYVRGFVSLKIFSDLRILRNVTEPVES